MEKIQNKKFCIIWAIYVVILILTVFGIDYIRTYSKLPCSSEALCSLGPDGKEICIYSDCVNIGVFQNSKSLIIISLFTFLLILLPPILYKKISKKWIGIIIIILVVIEFAGQIVDYLTQG